MSNNSVSLDNDSVSLTIDGIGVTVPKGTTILEAARKVNINIPTLCNFPGLGKRAVCRLCVVECDGRGKLVAACAGKVWEGARVVTNNLRIFNIRKTIVKLLLADHPPDCLNCVRSKKCELQTLASEFGIYSLPLSHAPVDTRPPETHGSAIVRNMSKCVKCGRCVETCQEVQTVRAINSSHRSIFYEICTPYGEALSEGPCIFCGQCAAVCPVGALYEYDQTAEVRRLLNDSAENTAVMIVPQTAAAMDREFGLKTGAITTGKMAAALKKLGFDRVYNAGFFADISVREESAELLDRIKNRTGLPMIICCSPGWKKFVKNFFPDLVNHLPECKNPEQNFNSFIKSSGIFGNDWPKISTVSVMPRIAGKYETRKQGQGEAESVDIALTTQELARMIKSEGIDIGALPESSFDSPEEIVTGGNNSRETDTGNSGALELFLKNAHKNYYGKTEQAEPVLNVKVLSVKGLKDARNVLESIRLSQCDAALAEVSMELDFQYNC